MAPSASSSSAKKAPAKKAPAKATSKAPATKAAPAAKKGAAPAKKADAAAPKKAPAKATSKAPATKAAPAAKKSVAPAKKAAPAAKKAPAPAKKATPAAKKAAPAAAKKPAPKKSPYGARFLAQQEKALQSERATYTRQFETLRAEADSLVADFESGDVQFDEESGEGDTINIERERDLALSEQARQAVEEIDHALAKIAAGTYGVCEVSGDPIPVERLEAIPWARERVEYKTGGLSRR